MRPGWAYAARLVIAVSLLALWLLGGMEKSYACSCGARGSPYDLLARATMVFAGKVVDTRGYEAPESGIYSSSDPVTIKIQVSTVWKGAVRETMFVKTVRSAPSCGFPFSRGREYLVYSHSDDSPPFVGLCGGTREAAHAKEDFQALGDGWAPEPGSAAPEPQIEPTAIPTQHRDTQPRAGGCSIAQPESHAPSDTFALGLIAGVAWLGFRRRPPG